MTKPYICSRYNMERTVPYQKYLHFASSQQMKYWHNLGKGALHTLFSWFSPQYIHTLFRNQIT